MRKYFVLCLCCIGLLVCFHSKALAEQSGVVMAPFEYVGEVVEPISPVVVDISSIITETLADEYSSEKKVSMHERASDIDKAMLHELKRQSERFDIPNSHMPDLPDAAVNNSRGIGLPHTAVTTAAPFEAMSGGFYTPPDPTIAAGPSNIAVAVNKYIAVYGKDGTRIIEPISFSTWFSSVGTSGMNLFDPWLVYDQGSSRFFFLVSSRNDLTHESYLYLSVSTSSNAAGSWCHYKLASDTTTWHDYGKLGIDALGVYLTSNKILFGQNVVNQSALSVYLKSELTACQASPSSWSWRDLRNSDGTIASSIQPALTLGGGPGVEYLVNARALYIGGGAWNGLTVWSVGWINNIPTLDVQHTYNVPTYYVAPDAQQPGTANRLDTSDGRLLNAVFQGIYLWTTHAVKSTDYNTSAVRIYKIMPPLLSIGLDYQIHSASGYHIFNPSIMPNANGNVTVVYNRSSTTEYPGIRYIKKVSGSWQPTVLLQAGIGSYDCYLSICRWGDYAGSSLDPSGDTWIYNEYGKGESSWGTSFAKIANF